MVVDINLGLHRQGHAGPILQWRGQTRENSTDNAMADNNALYVQSQHADPVTWISDGRDPLDRRVTAHPHVEKQDTAAPGGYRRGFFSEAYGQRADTFDRHLEYQRIQFIRSHGSNCAQHRGDCNDTHGLFTDVGPRPIVWFGLPVGH